jgi:hypothetical protein
MPVDARESFHRETRRRYRYRDSLRRTGFRGRPCAASFSIRAHGLAHAGRSVWRSAACDHPSGGRLHLDRNRCGVGEIRWRAVCSMGPARPGIGDPGCIFPARRARWHPLDRLRRGACGSQERSSDRFPERAREDQHHHRGPRGHSMGRAVAPRRPGRRAMPGRR